MNKTQHSDGPSLPIDPSLAGMSTKRASLAQPRVWLRQGTGAAAKAADEARVRKLKSSPKEQHDHLYQCLSILDGKAAALLQFDAILVAASAIVLTLQNAPSTSVTIMIAVALICAAVSSAMTLLVVELFWTEAHELTNDIAYAEHLLRVRDHRTIRYRQAWLLAWVSLATLAIGAAASQI